MPGRQCTAMRMAAAVTIMDMGMTTGTPTSMGTATITIMGTAPSMATITVITTGLAAAEKATTTAPAVITIPMTDAAKLMRLQSWLSPAFPIGAYSYSHGLEWAVEAGQVRDRASLVDWLEADLRFGTGRGDGIFFAQAWRAVHAALPGVEGETQASEPARQTPLPSGEGGGECVMTIEDGTPRTTDGTHPLTPALSPWEKESGRATGQPLDWRARPSEGEAGGTPAHPLLAIAELAAAMRSTSELVLEASQQGIAFLSAVRKAWPHPALDSLAASLRAAGITPMLPIAAGMACAAHGITLGYALPLFLHAGVANLINAAVRLVPLGQTDGQMALAALELAVAETATEALASSVSDIGSAAFMIDIASMQHETQYTRLFRS